MIIDNVGNYRKFGLPDKPRNWESMFAGLRVMNDIIVKPIYAHISNFRGDYAECRIGIQKCLYGLLDRRGNIILPPEYKYIYRWNEHAVEVQGNDGYSRTIEL